MNACDESLVTTRERTGAAMPPNVPVDATIPPAEGGRASERWLLTRLSRILGRQKWVDVYRRLYPAATEDAYTWWSTRGQAWAKNVGWRIDLQIATPAIAERAAAATVYKRRRFSDHAPLTVDYDWSLRSEE